jgi:diguanylate cyclase (GGDEF)-like protein
MQRTPPPPFEGNPSAMTDPTLEDLRSTRPVERLLEDSWWTRKRRISRRELLVESATSSLFLAIAVPLALTTQGSTQIDPLLAAMLVVLYAFASCIVRFPIGAGYVVPSYMVLVPMLLLLPPGTVPLLAALALMLGTLAGAVAQQTERERVFFSISDAWHTLGPAIVLVATGPFHGVGLPPLVYLGAFLAGCLVDLASATVRESAILGVGSHVQIRVVGLVWLIDACIAPLGLLVAYTAHHHHAAVLLLIPFSALMWFVSRDRTERIAQAQRRLDLIARERGRLQTAVRRLGDALGAKLDLDALTDIVLRGSVEALDADGGRLVLEGLDEPLLAEIGDTDQVAPALKTAIERTLASGDTAQVERDGTWALARSLGVSSEQVSARGALAVARGGRPFREDEEDVMRGLVEQARNAATDIIAHQLLREQALTDSLTKLGNRRKLHADLEERGAAASSGEPLVVILFDLDGFKSYNDTFGHLAGDALLARLGAKLAAAVREHGTAYRLGGDEFCVLATARSGELDTLVAAAVGGLHERGEKFAVGASCGAVLIPHEADTLDFALQLADERMYARKRRRHSVAGDQAGDVLMRTLQARQPALGDHSSEVAQLCVRVGRHFGMTAEELDELWRAAELHDIGKVAIPDAILEKPEALDRQEWAFMHQHTILGERILSAAPALRPVAVLVRASHERWDGKGYPDGIAGDRIPLGARIISACDAYEAMTSDRVYRARRDHAAACRELRSEAGRQFDPGVVDALLEELGTLGFGGTAPRPAVTTPDPSVQKAEEVVASLREVLARHETAGVRATAR